MATTQNDPLQPQKDAAKNQPEVKQPDVLQATGTKAVDAPDPLSDSDRHPQVVVNPELDPADNKVKLTERNVDPPTPKEDRDPDVRARDGEGKTKRGDDAPADTQAAREAAKAKADASLLGAEAGYGGRSGQIAARLRALNVPVVKAEDVGETGVRFMLEPRGGGAPVVYEADGVDANADWFIGRLRLAGYIV